MGWQNKIQVSRLTTHMQTFSLSSINLTLYIHRIEETEEEIKKRLNKWDQYLETEESKKSELQQNEREKDISESTQDE